jgi:peptide/nickel transport system substrate-binding protein
MTDHRVETTSEGLFTRRGFIKAAGLSVGAATLVARSGAEGQPKRGGVIRAVFSDGNSGDSLLATKMPNTWTPVMFLTMYDTITVLDNGFQPRPGLAESWESSNDAKTWTFRLRKSVKFHDGTPMTAKDVAYSLKFLMRKEAAT